MFTIKESLTREENLALAKESAETAKELLTAIETAMRAGFKHVPRYGRTKTQDAKLASPAEIMDRLRSETGALARLQATYRTRDQIEQDKLKKEEEITRKAEQEKQRSTILGEAIAYLIQAGKVINQDFTVDTAIDRANEVAFELEVKRKEALIKEPISFNGDDNCEDCSGWVPGERRCQCGNRRVGWEEGWSHSFKEPNIYAVAW